MAIGNFLHHYPGYDDEKVLRMPWCRFVALLRAARPEKDEEQDHVEGSVARARMMQEGREARALEGTTAGRAEVKQVVV